MFGGDGVQKRRADGRAAERELCRLAGPAEPAREDGSDPKLQSPHALPDELRVAAALCREVALRAAVIQIDRILVGLRLVRRRVADDEDHAAALQLIAERRDRRPQPDETAKAATIKTNASARVTSTSCRQTTAFAGRSLRISTLRSASTASIPIASRVLRVPLPMCGVSTTWSSASSSSLTSGSNS